jgi:aerobic carbon-monoxide dehydrogenase small subunit
MKQRITLHVNGTRHELEVPPGKFLLKVLREDLDLTGTKYSCGTGDCGACVVEVDGVSMNSCLLLAVEADGKQITTVEGLSEGVLPEQLHPIQNAFLEAGAVQCGYCTAGFLMTTKAFLDQNPDPSDEDIRLAFEGNLCRCTGYTKIVAAVKGAALALRQDGGAR